jgi:YjbE family integral membrane protein
MEMSSPDFWIALGQIIMIDILLGGDNAVVIALASRRLPDAQRKKAIFWGMFGAVALRVVLIFFALQLLKIPFLKIIGGLLLLYIGIKLLMPQDEGGGHDIDASTHLFGAVKTIVIADAVMSVDNVIGIAGAANQRSPAECGGEDADPQPPSARRGAYPSLHHNPCEVHLLTVRYIC